MAFSLSTFLHSLVYHHNIKQNIWVITLITHNSCLLIKIPGKKIKTKKESGEKIMEGKY